MNHAERMTMAGLGYSGLLPFYLSAGWVAMAGPAAEFAARVFVVYGAVILAFLGGTLWGYAVTVSSPDKTRRLLVSNVVALFAAAAGLVGSALSGVVLLAVGQLALLQFERASGDTASWYIRFRTRLSLGVLPAHLVMISALVAPGL